MDVEMTLTSMNTATSTGSLLPRRNSIRSLGPFNSKRLEQLAIGESAKSWLSLH